jgi:Fe-S-cluster formation regulator IscX/YfhJ
MNRSPPMDVDPQQVRFLDVNVSVFLAAEMAVKH